MCKNLIVAGIVDREAAFNFVMRARLEMTGSERDGYGYACLGDGKIYGEKWVDVKDAYVVRTSPAEVKDLADLELSLNIPRGYAEFGDSAAAVKPSIIMAHARTATNAVRIENTHPFYDETAGLALIHNGIISNPEKFRRQTTCDSEAILSVYIDNAVGKKPGNISDLAKDLTGSFACGILSREGYVDIFRNDGKPLWFAVVPGVGRVWATCVESIKCGMGKLEKKQRRELTYYPVKSGVMVRIGPDGKAREMEKFSSASVAGYTAWPPAKVWDDSKTYVKRSYYNGHQPAEDKVEESNHCCPIDNCVLSFGHVEPCKMVQGD